MSSSISERDGASFHLYVATSDVQAPGPFKDPRFCSAWHLRKLDDADPAVSVLVAKSNLLAGCEEGFHGKGTFPAVLAAMPSVEAGAKLTIFTDTYVADPVSQPASERRAKKYKGSGGKKALADAKALRQLDDPAEQRGITVTGRRPSGQPEEHHFCEVKEEAARARRNMGQGPGDWVN